MRIASSFILALSVLASVTAFAQESGDDPCKPKLEAAQKVALDSKTKFDQAKKGADDEFEKDKGKFDACMEGTIHMEDNHWALHVPEFVVKEQKWIFDFPKIDLVQKDMIFHTPSVKCDTGVIAHQPVTICEPYKPLENPFPKCRIEMREIIGTRCNPFMQEQRIRMGVPEVRAQRVEWLVKVPEMTMKRHDWYFKLPKFKPTSGCIGGSDCAQKCQGIMDNASTNYQNHIGPESTKMRVAVANSSHEVNMCYRDVMKARRDVAAAQYDAGIAQLQASIAGLAAQGNTDIVAQLRKDQERMMKDREEFLKKLNEGIASIEKADQQMMEEVTK
jgi:hypothetical protein